MQLVVISKFSNYNRQYRVQLWPSSCRPCPLILLAPPPYYADPAPSSCWPCPLILSTPPCILSASPYLPRPLILSTPPLILSALPPHPVRLAPSSCRPCRPCPPILSVPPPYPVRPAHPSCRPRLLILLAPPPHPVHPAPSSCPPLPLLLSTRLVLAYKYKIELQRRYRVSNTILVS